MSAAVNGWLFDWRDTWADVWTPSFLDAWRQLLKENPFANVYHVPEVVRAWAETHGHVVGAEPLFTIAEGPDGARVLCAFVVLAQRGRYATRRLLAPAGMSFFGYHDPLHSYRDCVDVDWTQFWNAVRLDVAKRCDHALIPNVAAAWAGDALAEPAAEQSPVLDLSDSVDLEGVLRRCSPGHRRNIRNLLRRMADRCGRLSLWIAEPGETAAALASFRHGLLPAYRRVWGESSTGVLFDQPGVMAFAERVINEGVPAGWAQYAVLRAGARDVAWHLGLNAGDSIYWWIPTYDIDVAEFSPGRLMVALMIERYIRNGVKRLHFLTGDHPYKREWQPGYPDFRTMRWHAPSMKGAVTAWYDRARALTHQCHPQLLQHGAE